MSKRASTLTVVGALALLLSACGAEQQGPPGGQMPPDFR